jgi:hypothetical protein
MVLSFWGIERNELALSHVLQSGEKGTGVLNVELLSEAGIEVSVETEEKDANWIKHSLDEGYPVIVAVFTEMLPYWESNRSHAVVVVGYDDSAVYLNDP